MDVEQNATDQTGSDDMIEHREPPERDKSARLLHRQPSDLLRRVWVNWPRQTPRDVVAPF